MAWASLTQASLGFKPDDRLRAHELDHHLDGADSLARKSPSAAVVPIWLPVCCRSDWP